MPYRQLRVAHESSGVFLLALCLFLGGGQGGLGDVTCQVLALVLIGFSSVRHVMDPAARLPSVALVAAIITAVPLFQLLPVPESIWAAAPGREAILTSLRGFGIEPADRVSLTPLATERGLYWLLPAIALFLSSLQYGSNCRRFLVVTIISIAAVSVLLGLAQLAGGEASPLRFYKVTNLREAVGFFANRNHLASLLVVALPFAIVQAISVMEARTPSRRGSSRAVGMVLMGGIVALLILGIALARSRAGMALGMVAVGVTAILVAHKSPGIGARRWLFAVLAIGVAISIQFAFFGVLERLRKDPLDDGRLQYLSVVAVAASEYRPIGTGIGGFRRAYEAADPAPGANFVNHAHNDWAELWMETAWAGVAGLIAAILVVVGSRTPGRERGALETAAVLGVVLLMLHSFVDYPLRTTALLAVFGVLAALGFGPEPDLSQRESSSSTKAGDMI